MFTNPKRVRRWTAIAVTIGLVCTAVAPAAKPVKPPPADSPVTYRMVGLSGSNGWPAAIAQLDGYVEMVGCLYDADQQPSAHHWMVDPAGNVLSTELQVLTPADPDADVSSNALDVNNEGVMVGNQVGGGTFRALLWPDATKEPIELLPPDGAVWGASADSINDAGIVVGVTINEDRSRNLVAWKVVDGGGGEWIVQDTLVILSEPGVLSVSGFPQIANSGYVSLTLYSAELADWRAFRLRLEWDDDQVWEVPDSRTQLFDVYSTANGINEAGTICGRCASPNPGEMGIAYVMTVSGALLDLPVLPAMKKNRISYSATCNEEALGLNNLAAVQIVGRGSRNITQGTYQSGEKVPLRWDGETSVTDVRTVTEGSPDLYELYYINDAGWITARTKDISGRPALPVVLIPSR